jgi:hypothetical protein
MFQEQEVLIHEPARDQEGWHVDREVRRGEIVRRKRYRFFDADDARVAYFAFVGALRRTA